VHPHQSGTVTQREVGADVASIAAGLRLALRQDADVVVAGDLPDPEACEAALACAEGGRLVVAAVRAPDAESALDRVVESFPEARRVQVRSRVADALVLVFAQRLLPRAGGAGRVPAWERLGVSARVRDAVRDRRVAQLRRSVERGAADYESLEECVGGLVRGGTVRFEDGLQVVGDARRYEAIVRGG
jgi:twitching motility protein PilT